MSISPNSRRNLAVSFNFQTSCDLSCFNYHHRPQYQRAPLSPVRPVYGPMTLDEYIENEIREEEKEAEEIFQQIKDIGNQPKKE